MMAFFSEAAPDLRRKRIWQLVYLLAVLAVVGWGAHLRFALPQQPMADPDIWGYLAPALSALAGHGFVHLEGRSFLYPGFVLGVLRWTQDMRALAVAQHLLGLGAGVFLLLSWNAAWRLLTAPAIPAVLWRWAGLVVTAVYLDSGWAIYFEHEIRPEAIFPFFAVLNIWLTVEFMRRRFIERSRGTLYFGAANLFVACAAFLIKPSFGVTVILSTLPVWCSLFCRGESWRRKAMMLGGAVLLVWALLFGPEARWAATDPATQSFVPETLFTIHAKIILRQMDEDLATHAATAYPPELLQKIQPVLAREIETAASRPGKKYPSLGFNPDYLMYQNSFCRALPALAGFDEPQRQAFYLYWYRRVWQQHPSWMLAKIGGQLRLFYRWPSPVYWTGRDRNFSERYDGTDTLMDQPKSEALVNEVPFLHRWIDTSTRLGGGNVITRQGHPEQYCEAALKYSYLALHLLAVLMLVATFTLPAVRGCRQLAWLVLIVYLYNLGNCLGLAIVHSLEIGRYVHIQLIFTMLAETLTLMLGAEMISRHLPMLARFRDQPPLAISPGRSL